MAGNSRSGRRPNPESIRSLRNSRTREHHKDEPKYQKVMPAQPELIARDEIAAQKWDEIGSRLFDAGVLDESHGEMLAMLCIAWADLDRAREQFKAMNYKMILGLTEVEQEDGSTITLVGDVKANPLAGRIEKLAFQVARFLGEFGLTPMSSAKVNADALAADEDPLADLLQFPNAKQQAS